MLVEHFLHRGLESVAVSAECRVIDDEGGYSGGAGRGQARSFRPIGDDKCNFGRKALGLGRLDQRCHVAAPAGDQNGNALLDHGPADAIEKLREAGYLGIAACATLASPLY